MQSPSDPYVLNTTYLVSLLESARFELTNQIAKPRFTIYRSKTLRGSKPNLQIKQEENIQNVHVNNKINN